MKKLFIPLILLIFLLAGCTTVSKCSWQPKKDYGPCEMVCEGGIYYDKTSGKCIEHNATGCSCPEYPFKIDESKPNEAMNKCKNECENK